MTRIQRAFLRWLRCGETTEDGQPVLPLVKVLRHLAKCRKRLPPPIADEPRRIRLTGRDESGAPCETTATLYSLPPEAAEDLIRRLL